MANTESAEPAFHRAGPASGWSGPANGPGFRRILYSSLVDVSIPYGPGVNERGFLKDMLARRGTELCAVIPEPSRGLPRDLAGLDVRFVPAWGSVRGSIGWLQSRAIGCVTLTRAIRSFQPDLIVIRTGSLSLPHLLAVRAATVPYVLKTCGDGTFGRFYAANPIRRMIRGLNRRVFGRILRGAASIDVVSSAERDSLIGLYPALASRIHVVDNGVDLEHFSGETTAVTRERLGFGSTDVVVGYLGTAPMQRGGKEVIDVVAGLKSVAPIKGLVVGDSGEAEQCRQYARERGVAESVVIYGEADYAVVPELLAAMDVGLSVLRPRERGAAEQKVRQYLACRLCVVGTAGSNEFLRGRDFARVIESTDPEEAVLAVEEFVRQGHDGMTALGGQARAFAESTLSIASRNDRRLEIWEESREQ